MLALTTLLPRVISFFSNPIVKYAGLALAAWLVLGQIIGAIEDRVLAQDRVRELQADIELLEQANEAVERARAVAEQTSIDLKGELDNVRAVLDEVRNASPEEDGPLAPVLCRALGLQPEECAGGS